MTDFTEALDNLPEIEEEDIQNILEALNAGTEGDYTHEDEERLEAWVSNTLTDLALLHLVAKGHLKIKWGGDDWLCSLTDSGSEMAEKVIVEMFIKGALDESPSE